ncbi:TetR/AcrR family transcriptional regulator [Streptomonospora sp. S1-112]|uniref:TetR/AcrR family transcriptional regulator n=1 Tax=Streptomonospora mangrovi TaxID=2883123 RepID=A0A9X3NP66_9ACTN|nr:TetR/AcrR family transcriptional regulator [Streptomonospora mangrovi]MDA0566933.1 TetR/AcrR family transcriptional regulator [Streptomonospora mangrovi]
MASKQQRLPRAVREQQVIDAAVRVFSRSGYHSASVDEIAEAAGVSKPMVYIYLGSKERLFTACIHREADRAVEAVRAALRSGEPPELGLWSGLREFFGYVAANRDAWRVLYQQARTQGEPFSQEVHTARVRVVDEITSMVVAGTALPEGGRIVGERDAEILARIAIGAADALTDWLLENPDETADSLVDRVLNLALVGVERYQTGDIAAPAPGTAR